LWTQAGRKQRGDGDPALARAEEKYSDARVFGVAEIHDFRGEFDQVLRWLNRAYAAPRRCRPAAGIHERPLSGRLLQPPNVVPV
jgi:hypothetical protein